MKDVPPRLAEAIKKIRLVAFDMDGVLTDGSITFDDNGNELKTFNALDGVGIKYLIRSGLKCSVITGRSSKALECRAKELGITDIYQKAIDKGLALQQCLAANCVSAEEMCFVGDDLMDIPVLRKVGFPVAVANAVPEAKEYAFYVTEKEGGKGAVREVVELILKTQDKWQDLLLRYTQDR